MNATKTVLGMLVIVSFLAMDGRCQSPSPILSGFDSQILDRNDDGSTGIVPIGFTVNFFGNAHTTLYVNNNGNVTFDSPLSAYSPSTLTSLGTEIIAPFWADVDTRNP